MNLPRLKCRGCLRVIGRDKGVVCLACSAPAALHISCRTNGMRSGFFDAWPFFLCHPCVDRAVLLSDTSPVVARAVHDIVIVESAPTLAHAAWCESYGMRPCDPGDVTGPWWGKSGATLK